MEFQQKHSKRKIVLLAFMTLVALGIAFVGVYVGALKKPLFGWPKEYAEAQDLDAKNVNSDAPSDDEKRAGDQTKASTIEKDQQANEGPAPSKPIQITLTANGRNGDIYQVRYLIESAVTSGVCRLTLTKGSQAFSQEADIQVLGGSSTCAGFNVPFSSLSPGEWEASLTVTSGDRTGVSTETISV